MATDPKQLKDYSAEIKEQLPVLVASLTSQAQDGQVTLQQLNAVVEQLLVLEKKTRLAADAWSTAEICTTIVSLCAQYKHWNALNDYIQVIAKRRAQLKKAIQNAVQEAMKYIETTPDRKTKLELIDTLRSVSAGKIFVELERARLTRMLATMKEQDGDKAGASETMQEVQIETLGSMEAAEKTDFLLEQMRLCLDNHDYVRTELTAEKVNQKILNKPEHETLKLKYHQLMIRFYQKKARYLDICKSYRAIFATKQVEADEAAWKSALSHAAIYLLLAPYDYEFHELLHRVKTEKKLDELPSVKAAYDMFTTDELMGWPLSFEAEWKSHDIFTQDAALWELFHKRVVQHNIRVVGKYYSRITTTRLAQLLQLDELTTEGYLSEIVTSKQLYAKIDRPAKVITFARKPDANQVLNDWSADVDELLSLVEESCHLINKEVMLAAVKA